MEGGDRLKLLNESLRGRDVLSRAMAGSGGEGGFGDVGRLLVRKRIGDLNEIMVGNITVGYLENKVYLGVFSRVFCSMRRVLRFRSRHLVPRITISLSHQLTGTKREISQRC